MGSEMNDGCFVTKNFPLEVKKYSNIFLIIRIFLSFSQPLWLGLFHSEKNLSLLRRLLVKDVTALHLIIYGRSKSGLPWKDVYNRASKKNESQQVTVSTGNDSVLCESFKGASSFDFGFKKKGENSVRRSGFSFQPYSIRPNNLSRCFTTSLNPRGKKFGFFLSATLERLWEYHSYGSCTGSK